LAGCGAIEGNEDGSVIIRVDSITLDGEIGNLVFPAHEATDDTGLDGVPDTGDFGEGDGLPQPGEAIIQGITTDPVIFTMTTTPRLGVDPSTSDNIVYSVVSISYRYEDYFGNPRPFAPPRTEFVNYSLPANSTVEVPSEMVLGTMKGFAGQGFIRDAFLHGTSVDSPYGDPASEFLAVTQWTAYITIKAYDPENDELITLNLKENIYFSNPMSTAAAN